MTPVGKLIVLFSLALLTACGAPEADAPTAANNTQSAKLSSFGVYEGYSTAQYSEWVRASQYVAMRDGVKLAVDVVRPAVDGAPVEGALPVVYTLQRYGRAHLIPGRPGVSTPVDTTSYIRNLVEHGYVYVSVGIRGSGASFGTFPGVHAANEARDAYDVAEWIVSQDWSNGVVGMMGNSYRANASLMAVSAPHSAVKAIFPSMMDFDNYLTARPGGVLLTGALRSWTQVTGIFDGRMAPPEGMPIPTIPPVDDDPSGELMAQAIAEHADNVDVFERSKARLYRDDYSYEPAAMEDENILAAMLPLINEAKAPVYLWSGWQDLWPKQPFLWMANLEGPKKLAIGPWSHDPDERDMMRERQPNEQERIRLQAIEMLRWFDYWLKGVENGIMDEPSYSIAVIKSVEEWDWIHTDEWPLKPKSDQQTFYLAAPEGDEHGRLSLTAPTAEDGEDRFEVDFTATTGDRSRWIDATSFFAMNYPDLTPNAEKGVYYLSEPAEAPFDIIGHPVIKLYATSTAPDADFFAYLEILKQNGDAHYLTEGVLRASHRTVGRAPYDNLGLPWRTHARADAEQVAPLSGDIAELTFDLLPLSQRFEAGDRIRLTITGADADNFELYMEDENPVLSVARSASQPSSITLPIIEAVRE